MNKSVRTQIYYVHCAVLTLPPNDISLLNVSQSLRLAFIMTDQYSAKNCCF